MATSEVVVKLNAEQMTELRTMALDALAKVTGERDELARKVKAHFDALRIYNNTKMSKKKREDAGTKALATMLELEVIAAEYLSEKKESE